MDFYDKFGFFVFIFFVTIDSASAVATGCPRLTLPNGRVRFRSRGATVMFRCRRGFTRIGAKMAICLKSKQWSQEVPRCAGPGCPALDLPPAITATELHQGAMLHFTCASGYTRQGPERIYCNGQDWNTVPPTCSEGISLGCDFETEGLCGWSQAVESDNYDWVRHKGQTATRGTGPKMDHTLGTAEGHYLFMEASSPSKKGQTVQLVSPKYDPRDVLGICMEFFYHMYGSNRNGAVGSLEVFVKPDDVPLNQLKTHDKSMSVFQMDGNQDDEWHQQEIDIPLMDDPFQFVFEASKGSSWLSDIALDDIRLYNCTNSTTTIITSPTERSDPIRTTTTTTTPRPTTTTTTTPRPTTTTTTTPRPTTTTTTTTTTTRRPTTTTTTPRSITTRRRTTTTTAPIWVRRQSTPFWVRRQSTTSTTTMTTLPWWARRSTTTTAATTRQTRSTAITQKAKWNRRTTSTTPQNVRTRKITTTTTTLRDTRTRQRTTTTTQKSQNSWTRKETTTSSKMATMSGGDNSQPTPGFHPLPDATPKLSKSTTKQPPSFTSEADTTQNPAQKASTLTNTNANTGNPTTGATISVGKSQDKPNSPASSSTQLIPLIAGVAAAVLLVAVVVAVLAFKWSKKQRAKEEKDMDDQMNIITDYVETSLVRN